MGFWDRYDHPRYQPVPINRMAGIAQLLALLGAIASPLCLGIPLLIAAIVLAHNVQGRLDPYDVAGKRHVRTALWVGYGFLGGETFVLVASAAVLVVFVKSPPAGVLLAVFVFLGLLAVTFGVIVWFVLSLANLVSRANAARQ